MLDIERYKHMGNRIALLSIIVEDRENVDVLNGLLHDFSEYIIGRMGLPYKAKEISLISIAMDAPEDVISNLSGKIGQIAGVTVKAAYSKH